MQQSSDDHPKVPTAPVGNINHFIQVKCNQILNSPTFKKLEKYFPFMTHTNFKIIVFLSGVVYGYIKIKSLKPKNAKWYRLVDDVRLQQVDFQINHFIDSHFISICNEELLS